MMQKLHFQSFDTKKGLLRATFSLCLFILLAFPLRAQLSEEIINSEYREIILKELQKSVEKREQTLRNRAQTYLLALPNDRKLYDESKMNIKADLVSGVTPDGLAELNYQIAIDYTCHHIESTSDNYPTGEYLCEESNASMALCELTRIMIDQLSKDAFTAGKRVTIKIKASTDVAEVTHLDYGGEYGDFQYVAARYNGESVRISVSRKSGIATNAQLAFLRAQGIRDNITKNITLLKNTENEYLYETQSYSETGSQYRSVGIEIVVHQAFNSQIVEMNERLTNDEYVDYNIPKNPEGTNTKTYALIVANENYDAPLPDVPYAHNDGEIFAQYCTRTLGIPARQVKLLEEATLNDIKKEGVEWLKNIAVAQKGDCNFIVYFAGLGFTDYDHNPYIAPAGVKCMDRIDLERNLTKRETKCLLSQCIRLDTLCAWFNSRSIKSAPVVTLILDATFDNNNRDGEPIVNIKQNPKSAKNLRIRNDVVVFSAAAFDKTAYSYDEQRHGFFTYFLLKELKTRKGDVNYYDLYNSIDLNLQKETSLQGKLQEPTITVGGKIKDKWTDLKFR